MTSDERILGEIRAALRILEQHQPAALTFRLSRDVHGRVWLRLERMEGVPLAALAETVDA